MSLVLRQPAILLASLLIGLSSTASAATISFSYTGGLQSFLIPDEVYTIQADLWGAGEGRAGTFGIDGVAGGFAEGRFDVTPGETLSIYVGAGGTGGTTTTPNGEAAFVMRGVTTLLFAGGGGSSLGSFVTVPQVTSFTLINPGGANPPQTFNPHYANGAGRGGTVLQQAGDGLVVLNFQPVPEPATVTMLGIGVVGLVGRRYRQSRR